MPYLGATPGLPYTMFKPRLPGEDVPIRIRHAIVTIHVTQTRSPTIPEITERQNTTQAGCPCDGCYL